MASLVRRVKDLVVEDREVQSQSETDRVGRSKLRLSDFSGALVGLKRIIGSRLATVANGELSKVTVVITLPVEIISRWSYGGPIAFHAHLMVEDLRFTAVSRGNQVLVENLEDVIADLGEFSLDLLAVLLDEGDLGLVALGLFFLFNGGDDSPRRTAGTDDVLVGNREEIPLLNRELDVGRGDNLHVLDHFWGKLVNTRTGHEGRARRVDEPS